MHLPQFIIIGAAKCGTTTLYEYLCRHPSVFMCEPKEPEFFGREALLQRGIGWYEGLFAGAQAGQVCGEASTLYTNYPTHPDVARRIRETLPDVKLIYLVREPVRRTYSHFVQEIKNQQWKGGQRPVRVTFEQRLAQDDYLLDASDYLMQIKQYERWFPRAQMLVLVFEQFVRDPRAVLARVCRFLDIDDGVDLVQDQPVMSNTARGHVENFSRNEVARRVMSLPGTGIVRRALPRAFRQQALAWLHHSAIGQRVRGEISPAPMTAETGDRLRRHFRQLRPALETHLGVDLGCWDR